MINHPICIQIALYDCTKHTGVLHSITILALYKIVFTNFFEIIL